MIINYQMDELFERDGDMWRVTATAEHFIIATRASVEGEPVRSSDVVKVMK